MHQFSLLGGLGNAQTLRPDRVYATGVLSPMVGFRPGQDVQTIATAFTMGPNTGMQLGRLRGPKLGDKIKIWWHGVKTRARGGMPNANAAAAAQAAAIAASAPTTATEPVLHAPGASAPPMRMGWGGTVDAHGYSMAPKVNTAFAVGPYGREMPAALVSRAYGQSPSLPPFAGEAAAKTTMMMWRGLRWPWG